MEEDLNKMFNTLFPEVKLYVLDKDEYRLIRKTVSSHL